jgi:hypothetical protein
MEVSSQLHALTVLLVGKERYHLSGRLGGLSEGEKSPLLLSGTEPQSLRYLAPCVVTVLTVVTYTIWSK